MQIQAIELDRKYKIFRKLKTKNMLRACCFCFSRIQETNKSWTFETILTLTHRRPCVVQKFDNEGQSIPA